MHLSKQLLSKKPWIVIPSPENYKLFKRQGRFARWFRWFSWNYMSDHKKLGLLWHDILFEPAPEVTEALRRLQMKEPHVYDGRMQRLSRATLLVAHHDRLPKVEWTKWEQETFYLAPYLAEVEREKMERFNSSGMKPGFWPTGSYWGKEDNAH